MKDIHKILKHYWGYESFRELQQQVIQSVCSGHDTLALMPTGGGKSITYQVSALAMNGMCIVVTPLISLMKDQVDALRKRRIMAQAIHSGYTSRQIDVILDNCIYGDYKFLYVSPERLETDTFKARLSKMDVALIAVDEAHCISQWGYDFRPSYLKIADIRKIVPSATILAVTATAPPIVVEDIMTRLDFETRNVHRMSFARPNLSYIVRESDNKTEQLLHILQKLKGSGIIYCPSRKECETTAKALTEQGISCDFYHGGLNHKIRSVKQEGWMNETIRVIVATNAFGMGIDKSDVRFVIHTQMPGTLEAYYQEAGRAGRDNKPSFAVVLHSSSDNQSLSTRLRSEFPEIKEIRRIYDMLFNYYGIAIGEGKMLSRDFNIYDFCYKFKFYPGTVFNAIKILQMCGYMTLTDEADHATRILFIVSREELYKIEVVRNDIETFVRILLRLYTGLFSDFTAIDEEYIAAQSGYSVEYIQESFKKLWTLRVLNYIPRRKSPLLIFTEERLSADNLRISPESYSFRKEMSLKRLSNVIAYLETTDCCRSVVLQRYFGEKHASECGKCDICRSKKERNNYLQQYKKKVVALLKEGESIDLTQLAQAIPGDRQNIKEAISILIQEGIIELSDNGTIRITRKQTRKQPLL